MLQKKPQCSCDIWHLEREGAATQLEDGGELENNDMEEDKTFSVLSRAAPADGF